MELRLVLLGCASGSMDILSYLMLGQVFTSAMTGNAALLGLALGRGDMAAGLHNLTALVVFVIGLALGSVLLRNRHDQRGWTGAITRVLVYEELLLIGFVLVWIVGAGPSSEGLLHLLIALSALAMGLQSALAGAVGVPGMSTTYFTGTLASIITGWTRHALPFASEPPPRSRIRWQALAFLAYVAAAAVTGLLATRLTLSGSRIEIAALPAIAVALVLAVAFAKSPPAR